VVTNEEQAKAELKELVAKGADSIKVWQDSRRVLMPRPVIEFLIAEAHRNNLASSRTLMRWRCCDPGSMHSPIPPGARRTWHRWTMSSSRCSRPTLARLETRQFLA
jgi:hypothetical protein